MVICVGFEEADVVFVLVDYRVDLVEELIKSF